MERGTTMLTCLFVCLSVIWNRGQLVHRSLIVGEQGPLCPPWLLKAVCNHSGNMCMAPCHGWHCAISWNWPKLITICRLSLPNYKPSIGSQVPKLLHQTKCYQHNCCLGGETFLMLPTLLSCRNSLIKIFCTCVWKESTLNISNEKILLF